MLLCCFNQTLQNCPEVTISNSNILFMVEVMVLVFIWGLLNVHGVSLDAGHRVMGGSVNFSHHSQNLLFGVKTSSQATKLCQSETLAD